MNYLTDVEGALAESEDAATTAELNQLFAHGTAVKKVLDVQQKDTEERKFLKEGSREYANTVLGERKAFVFGEMKEDAEGGEEQFVAIKINAATTEAITARPNPMNIGSK